MSAGENRDLRVLDAIPDQVREAAQDRPAHIAIQRGIDIRRIYESVQRSAEFGMKLSRQARLLIFIPLLRLRNVQFGGRRT